MTRKITLVLRFLGVLRNASKRLSSKVMIHVGYIARGRILQDEFQELFYAINRYIRAAGRFNLLMRIRPLIDRTSAEKIYKPMIQPVFTYCGTLGLCWTRSRKSRIESIKRGSQKVIGGNYQVQTVESLLKRQSCQLVFDCLQDNVCTPFEDYFTLAQKLKFPKHIKIHYTNHLE